MDARRNRDVMRATSIAATRKRGRRRSMDATILTVALYLTATFAAALVTGVAGFACRRRLAAHPYTDADRNVDHRLRAGGAGHLGLEIAVRAAVEPAVAISVGRGLRRPF